MAFNQWIHATIVFLLIIEILRTLLRFSMSKFRIQFSNSAKLLHFFPRSVWDQPQVAYMGEYSSAIKRIGKYQFKAYFKKGSPRNCEIAE